MIITNPYNPSQGPFIISPAGSQKYTEALNSYSQVFANLYTSAYNHNNKFCIDSCWESGNIYYANYDEGYVKKIAFDGTEIASLSLTSPFMVSVIQNSAAMNVNVTYPPQDDKGCWIADIGIGKIIKTDKNLNIEADISGITSPVCIKADIDGGCYVVQQTLTGGSLIKLSSNAEIMATMDYTTGFVPAITSFIDMAIDINGNVLFCADDRIYGLIYTNGLIQQSYIIYPFLSVSSSSSEEDEHIGAIDVDRNVLEQFLYVTGGNSSKSFVLKYIDGVLITHKHYPDISFPYVLKVIQGMGSDSLYILEDSAKWDDYGYGSSSSTSSSSSTEIRSSSSSSSSSTEIRSSSSSSSVT